MAEEFLEGTVKVNFDDREVEVGLDALMTKFHRDMATIGRERAVVKVKYDLQDAKKQLAEARGLESDLAAAVSEREKAIKKADASAKGGYTAALNRERAALKAAEDHVSGIKSEVDALDKLYTQETRLQEQQKINDRVVAAREQARKRNAQEKLRETQTQSREEAAASRQAAKIARDAEAARAKEMRDRQQIVALQKRELDTRDRANRLAKVEGRMQGSDRIRARVDTDAAVRDMLALRAKLEALNARPIAIKTKTESQGIGHKALDFFGFTADDNIKDLSTRIKDMASGAKNARVNIGFLSTSVAGLAIGLATLAPIITGLVGALGALVAVTGSALAGALGVASAGAAGFGMAAIGMFAAVKPLVNQFAMAHQATTAYNLAIAKYGENSKKGQAATKVFNNEMKSMPPLVRNTVTSFHQLSSEWKKLTSANTNKALANIFGETFHTIRSDMGFFAKDTNQTFNQVAVGWKQLMTQFRSKGAQQGMDTIFQNFNKTIPTIADAVSHLADAFGRIVVNFSTHLPGLMKGFDKWATNFDNASKKTSGFSHGVDQAVHSMQSMGHLAQALTKFLISFFKGGVEPGTHLVDDMTKGLDKLTKQMNTTAGQSKLTDFYTRSIKTTKELWAALLPLISAFVQFSQAVAPLATVGLTLVGWFTKFVALAAGFAPLKYFGGFLLGVSIIGRLTSNLRGAVGLVGTLFGRINEIRRMEGGLFNFGNWKSTAGGSEAAKIMNESILAASREGAAMYREAIVSASVTGGAEIAAEERAGLIGAGGIGSVARKGEGAVVPAARGAGFASKAARGFGIAATGVLGSQIVGDAIGGKAGTAVSNIGSTTSAGAGLGSFFGPEGTIAGAFAGALVGGLITFVHGDSVQRLGDEFSKKFTRNLGTDVGRPVQSRLSKDVQDAKKFDISHFEGTTKGSPLSSGPGSRTSAVVGQGPSAADRKKSDELWSKAGREAANAFTTDFSHARFPTATLFTADALHQIDAMRPRMRKSGAQGIVEYAAGMVEKKQMTAQQFGSLLDALEKKVPGFRAKLNQEGIKTAKDFATNFKFKQASNNLAHSLQGFRDSWKDYNLDPNVTGDNAVKNLNTAMKDLKNIMAHGTRAQREAAMGEYRKLQSEAKKTFGAMGNDTASKVANMRQKIWEGSKQAQEQASGQFAKLARNIEGAMKSGAISVSAGVTIIMNSLNAALKAVGGTELSKATVAAAAQHGQIGNVFNQASAGISEGAINSPKALGGRVPGPVGPDTWTLVDPGGNAAAMVGGGEILVTNRHTENRVNSMLAPYGTTLGAEVAGEHKPHSHALGGRVPSRATGGNVWSVRTSQEDASSGTGWTELSPNGNASAQLGIPHSFSNNPAHYPDFASLGRMYPRGYMLNIRGPKGSGTLPLTDVGDGSTYGPAIGLTPAAASVVGSPGGVMQISAADGSDIHPFPGMATLVSGSGGLAGGAAGGAAPTINAPGIKGKGAPAEIARHGMKMVADAANKYIMAHMPVLSGGGGGAGPTFPIASGPLPPQVQWALSAARTIANEHLPYGFSQAGWGHSAYDCSGYVSTVMDAAGIWPKWAYYTASNPINAHTDDGPGKWITIATLGHSDSGPQDHTMMEIDGHFFESGAGHGPAETSGWSSNFTRYGHPHGFARGGRTKHPRNYGSRTGEPGHQPTLAQLREYSNRKMRRGIAGGDPGEGVGAIDYAGAFANGGIFTANRPTIGLFGEGGPETVVAIPHAKTGRRVSTRPTTHTTTGSGGGRHESDYRPTVLGAHHSPSGLFLLKKRDYIGGVPTDDLDTAVTDAQAIFGNDWKAIHTPHTEQVKTPHDTTVGGHTITKYDKNGKKSVTIVGGHTTHSLTTKSVKVGGSPETDLKSKDPKVRAAAKKKLDDAHKLYLKWKNLEKMQKNAKEYAAQFTNLETQMSTIGTYMDTASTAKDDKAFGVDSKGRRQHWTWARWKKELLTLEQQHVSKLRVASRDIHKLARGDRRASTVGIVRAIDSALGSANSDLATARSQQDAGHPALKDTTGVDDFIAAQKPGVAKGLRAQLDRLTYAYSLAPEGSTTQQGVAKSLWDFYAGLFALGRKEQPKNFPLLTALHDAETGAEQTYKSITPLTGGTAGTPEDYMTLLQGGNVTGSFTNQLGALNYAASVAQGNNIPDDPATAAREDLDTLRDDLSSANDLMNFYSGLFTTAKSDTRVKGNYGLLTSLSDAYNSARGTWQGLQQQFTDAATQTGPSQPGLYGAGISALLGTYSGNVASPVTSALGGGAQVNPTLQGTGVTGGPGGAAGGAGTNVHITNHFPTPPDDPHSWAKGVSWEISHAI